MESLEKRIKNKVKHLFDIKNWKRYHEPTDNIVGDLDLLKEKTEKLTPKELKARENDIINNIKKVKEAIEKRTGRFKYDDCYDDCIKIIALIKK